MNFQDILAITGKPGLYKMKAKTRNGFMVTSLMDGRTSMVNISHNVSVLSDISIYTYDGEETLPNVFAKISEKENGNKTSVSHKGSKKELQNYFEQVLPSYDPDRVYASDIKKVMQWYNLLTENNHLQEALDEEE